jgi:hypothetical protein
MRSESLFASHQHPIFVLGILQRSGTNYLNNLLLLHPDIKSPGLVWEDFFLAHGDLLAGYMESVQRRWPHQWVDEVGDELGPNALLKHIGRGLVDFMEAQYRNRLAKGVYPMPDRTPVNLVTATPSVRNLHLFFDLFPNAAPIIIVRDGRALVESGVRSFGWNYDEAMRMWSDGARRIQDFCRNPAHEGRFLVVRYEDLYTRTSEVMGKMLDFLRLDHRRYDFTAAENLGVMGSSELMNSEGRVHWKAVDKSAGFNPLARASQWEAALNSRFAWIAGKNMQEFHYEMGHAERRLAWNMLLDRSQGLSIRLQQYCPAASVWLRSVGQRLLQGALKKDAPHGPA